jgi:P4 family phage/plasmid primase-like protien
VEELESNRFMVGNLLGKLLFLDDDVKAGTRLPDGALKKIGEAKTMTGEKKFGSQFQFTCLTVPVLLCNNPLSLADVSHGMLRRLMIIPFDHRFTEKTVDRELFDKIWAGEMSGILNRALEGFRRVMKRGLQFKPPDSIANATAGWIRQSNPIPTFIEECCEVGPTYTCYVKFLYAAYLKWSAENGYTMRQQRSTFQRNLSHLNYTRALKGKGGARVQGLRLRSKGLPTPYVR